MAQTPSKRWDQFDKKARREMEKPWVWNQARIAELLRLQHNAFVRLVKKMQKPYLSCRTEEQRSQYAGRVDMCADLLAALQQGGKK